MLILAASARCWRERRRAASPSRRALRSLVAILGGIAAFFVNTALSLAAEDLAIVKPGDMRAGSLLLKRDGDGYADATRLGIDVDLTVSGPTIRARVTQIFRNPTRDWVEATYVYPLPDGAAVDTLKMVIGDKVVVDRKSTRLNSSHLVISYAVFCL